MRKFFGLIMLLIASTIFYSCEGNSFYEKDVNANKIENFVIFANGEYKINHSATGTYVLTFEEIYIDNVLWRTSDNYLVPKKGDLVISDDRIYFYTNPEFGPRIIMDYRLEVGDEGIYLEAFFPINPLFVQYRVLIDGDLKEKTITIKHGNAVFPKFSYVLYFDKVSNDLILPSSALSNQSF